MEFDDPVLVSNAFFGHREHTDLGAPEATLESLCGVSDVSIRREPLAHSSLDRCIEIVPLPRRLGAQPVLSLPA